MTDHESRDAVLAALHRVAPDVDAAGVTDDTDLQDDLELDSMDVLNLMAAIEKTTGVTIPESDYPQVTTVGALVGYVAAAGEHR